MLILFINCHRKTPQGTLRFTTFLSTLRPILHQTIYYGAQVTQTIRTYDQLDDYIYDEVSFRVEQKNKSKFEALQYVIVEGSGGWAPWNQNMKDVGVIIRQCGEKGKKILCCGFGHFSAHYWLTTKFDKHYSVSKPQQHKPTDYQWQQTTGDLLLKGHKICNSGLKIITNNRPFSAKSSQALSKGLTLSTKLDYVVFDAKSGSKLLRNIESPFGFYWKSKLFCCNKNITQMKGQVLFQTQNGSPVAFSYKNLLSVQGLCPQFLKLIRNWLAQHTQRNLDNPYHAPTSNTYHSIAFQNKMEYRKILSSNSTSQLHNSYQLRTNSKVGPRPQSSKFSTLEFEKPVIRCSGKYETLNQRYLHQENFKKTMNVGRSRMIFQGKLSEMEIGNYVQRQPSRPASSHKFREVKKDKWVGNKDFINC